MLGPEELEKTSRNKFSPQSDFPSTRYSVRGVINCFFGGFFEVENKTKQKIKFKNKRSLGAFTPPVSLQISPPLNCGAPLLGGMDTPAPQAGRCGLQGPKIARLPILGGYSLVETRGGCVIVFQNNFFNEGFI